jgi:putative ABC transport system permease protein
MLKNYFKMAFKVLLKHKLFTFISLFGISMTLLILIVITSLIDHTFGTMPPETNLDRTLSVTMARLKTEKGGTWTGPLMSYYFFDKYVDCLETPELISVSSFHIPITTYKGDKKLNLGIKFTDGEFWKILNFDFIEGKPYTVADVENANQVAVITEMTREKYFGGNSAVGEIINADGKDFKVIGVVKNVSILRIMPYSDIWVPITLSKEELYKPTLIGSFPGFYAMVLARDKSDIPKIKDEFQSKLANIEFPEGRFTKIFIETSTYAEALSRQLFRTQEGKVGPLLLVLLLLAIIFMLLPSINLVNINISRIVERESEIGIRKAFGASSLSLVGQFVIENILITMLGGLIALVFAAIVLESINNSGLIPHVQLGLNYRIFFYSVIISLIFGLVSGVYPAYKMSRLHPAEALRGGKA